MPRNCTNPDVSDFEGACRCQSLSACDNAVAYFCGVDTCPSLDNCTLCDPRPKLCPTDGDLPVGYVRAYLQYFLDALPAFRGTGFGEDNNTDSFNGAPEFIISPNILKNQTGLYLSEEVNCTME